MQTEFFAVVFMIEIDKANNKTHLKTKPATEPYLYYN